MSVNDILERLDHLSPDELKVIEEKIELLKEDFKETPEMLAAIDEGLRSSAEGKNITIEEMEERMKSWTFKSS